ncbi:hypothetical protein ACC754_41455, partial [Rhizobium johnstonii]
GSFHRWASSQCLRTLKKSSVLSVASTESAEAANAKNIAELKAALIYALLFAVILWPRTGEKKRISA